MAITTIASTFLFVFLTLFTQSAVSLPQAGSGLTYSASFTYYGPGDGNGSGTCTSGGACGLPYTGGHTAAVSTALFNTGACGSCWQLTANGQSIVVKVDNECPASSNIVCNQSQLGSSVNSLGAQVNFDLCLETDVRSFFVTGGTTTGSATRVACS